MTRSDRKLSLVCQFDDTCRRCSMNTDTTDEELLLEFVRSQEECRKRWHSSVAENAELMKLVASLTATNKELERKLANAREVLKKELLRREKCEDEVQIQQLQLDLFRAFLANTTELPDETAEKLSILVPPDAELHDQGNRQAAIDVSVGSVLSPSGDSLDVTGDGSCGASTPLPVQAKRRHSTFFGSTSPVAKKHKPAESSVLMTTCGADLTGTTPLGESAEDEMEGSGESAVHRTIITANGKEPAQSSKMVGRPSLPPAPLLADSAPLCPPSPPPPAPTVEAHQPSAPATPKLTSGSAPSTPVAQRRAHAALGASMPRRSSSAEKLLTRQHSFITKTALKTDATCGPCGKRIWFYKTIFKCSRCQSICHPQCKYQVPLPCVAPCKTLKRNRRPLISDYAPPTPPMVPALVVHCIQEVERRGLDAVGIYRVPGAEREVRAIREQFQPGRGVPNLAKADVYAVCGALKDFLRSLSETLITKSLWQTFVEAAELEGEDQVWSTWQAVSQLPRANRDTLALLVLHLQTVAAHPEAKMPVPSLVRIFAPTVVGFSEDKATPAPSMLGEVDQQYQVMETLLSVPAEYWAQVLDS
ncbi:rac GTPase-activating protein 1-like [Amblyomma americanum]